MYVGCGCVLKREGLIKVLISVLCILEPRRRSRVCVNTAVTLNVSVPRPQI